MQPQGHFGVSLDKSLTNKCECSESRLKIINTMKYRISFFIEDYYSYLGKDPDWIAESKRNKVLGTIPYGFREKLYNLKFKEVKCYHGTFYRVHFSVNMEESEIKEIFDKRRDWCHTPYNISYKQIKTHDKRRSNFNSR